VSLLRVLEHFYLGVTIEWVGLRYLLNLAYNIRVMIVTKDQVHFKAVRSHKPGGMNRDHRSTKVHMWVPVEDLPLDNHKKHIIREKLSHHINHNDEIWIECEEERSQEMNREKALEHLNQIISDAIDEDPKRLPTAPNRLDREKRLHNKHHHSHIKKARRASHGSAD
jgi:ribosome-associated protein